MRFPFLVSPPLIFFFVVVFLFLLSFSLPRRCERRNPSNRKDRKAPSVYTRERHTEAGTQKRKHTHKKRCKQQQKKGDRKKRREMCRRDGETRQTPERTTKSRGRQEGERDVDAHTERREWRQAQIQCECFYGRKTVRTTETEHHKNKEHKYMTRVAGASASEGYSNAETARRNLGTGGVARQKQKDGS